MDLIRENKRAAYAVAAGLALILAVVAWSVLRGGHSGNSGQTVVGTPVNTLPLPGASIGGSDKHKAKSHAKGANPNLSGLSNGLGNGLGAGLGLTGFALNDAGFPGLAGHGFSTGLPKIPVVLSVHSDGPIGTVGYFVPTNPHNSSGTIKNVGTSWVLNTYAYGKPDYARIFVGSGYANTVTCTITVNGHVTDQRSTKGPYGETMCQG